VWKESYFASLFKSVDQRKISNYRGISILSATPKIFQKLVCDVIIRQSISDEQDGLLVDILR
jgi:hypothetical protein